MHKIKRHFFKNIYIFLFIFFFSSVEAEETARIKKGFVFGALPALSFDSDLGLEYGFLTNFYFFGDGSRYPLYNHSFYIEFSKYTKGSEKILLSYDSDKLLKNIRTSFDVLYRNDMLAYFYGLNGYNAVYNDSLESRNRAFYRYDSKTLQVKLDLQDNFGDTHWGWMAGLNSIHINTGSVDIDKINSDKTNTIDQLPDEPDLYDKYVKWGIISEKETKPNWINYLNVGLKYDTRTSLYNPYSGIFTEMMVQTAPTFLLNNFPHSRFAFIHRQYVPIVKKKITFAYRFFYQTNVGNNHIPFYAQSLLMNSSGSNNQGLGGGRSLRGVMRNRVLGDGFFMTNAELRTKLFQKKIVRQYFDFGLNFFIDTGCITKETDVKDVSDQLTEAEKSLYFTDVDQSFHTSGGMGFKGIMNDNFVVSLDLARAFDKRDGKDLKIYINMNFIF